MHGKNIFRNHLVRKLTGFFLILALIGTAPGTSELFKARAQTAKPFTEEKIEIDKDNPLSVTTDVKEASVSEVASTDKTLEEVKKKEMSRAEEIAWTIGKALLPTLAVMAFSAAVVCPLAWVVVGAVAAGAASAGLMTLGYEMRKNSFRSESEKKSMDKIWRDVTIAAAVNGAMAPFSMLTAGIAQAVGPVTMRTIVQTAAKAGAVSFLGSTVSNVTKGAVINLWYDHYYNYDEKEKILKSRIETLSRLKNRSPEQEEELVGYIKELDTITKEKYTWESFRKDEKKALVSAGISGVLGGAAAKMGAESDWAKIVSSKLFGSTSKSAMVSNAVISNPFAFATGAAVAGVNKKELLNEIAMNRILQAKYEEGSPAWKYYEEKISVLSDAYKNTSLLAEGKKAMISNAAMQAAIVGTSLAKTRLWDLPSAKRGRIQQKYEEQDAEWQKVNYIRNKLEIMRAKRPVLSDFNSRKEYSQALRAYAEEMKSLRDDYKKALIIASDAQKQPENQAKIKEIAANVTKEIEYERLTELAKSLGTDSYLKFKLKELEAKPENNGLTAEELKTKAEFEIRQEFAAAAKASAEKLVYLENKLKRKNLELHGDIERGPDGKNYVVIRDANGNKVRQREYQGGEGAYWYDKLKYSKLSDLKEAEIARLVKEAYNSASMVKPSAIRNEYVNMKVNELRAQGYNDNQIDQRLGDIVNEANKRMLANFGGSWAAATKAEVLAVGLEKAKYDDGASPSLKKMLSFLRGEVSNKAISIFQEQLKDTVQKSIPTGFVTYGNNIERLLGDDEAAIERASSRAVNNYYQNR
ncbi:MAG: hypothetical protein Kow0029_19270 [Candidatus Rifleibacteriota bacterium]